MKEIINLLFKNKNFVLFLGIIFISLQSLLIIAVDIRWFWLTSISLPVTSLCIYLYKNLICVENRISKIIHTVSLISIVISEVFVLINGLFITPFWWFGLSIPIYLLIQHIYFYKHFTLLIISDKDKATILYGSIIIIVLITGLYITPSFIANDHSNPNINFPSINNYDAVDSYQIYFEEGLKNREHVIARSWYEDTPGNYVNDFVNVIWSNQAANSARGNLIFSDIPKSQFTEVFNDRNVVGYRTDEYFMPLDRYKGDVARIVLYMYVTYKDDQLPLEKINIDLMKYWSAIDPVSTDEITRNNTIRKTYGYGNKFVEYPWLIGFIV